MRTFIVNYNWPLEYKGTYQVTVEDSLTASIDAMDKVRKYLVEKFGEVKDSSSSTIVEVYGAIHKIDDTKAEEWSEEDKEKIVMCCKFLHDSSQCINYAVSHKKDIEKCIQWLKSLCVSLKKRNEAAEKLCSNEWSEEDKEMYARIVRRYTDYEGVIMRTKEEPIANKMLDAMAQEEIWLKQVLGIK